MSKSPGKLMDGLTDKQKAFCYEYLKCSYNGTKAAIAAGYAKSGAYQEAHRLLRNAEIREAINALLELQGYTPEFCKIKLGGYATADIADFEPWLMGVQTLKGLKAAGVDTSLVKSATIRQTKEGENRRIELHDGQHAVETMVKLHGLVTQKREVEHSGRVEFAHLSTEELERMARVGADDDEEPEDAE